MLSRMSTMGINVLERIRGAVQRIFIFKGMGMGVLIWIIANLLALPLGIIVDNIPGKVDAPLDPGFSLTGVMAGHRVGFLCHCQFLLCLESVPVDCERAAGI